MAQDVYDTRHALEWGIDTRELLLDLGDGTLVVRCTNGHIYGVKKPDWHTSFLAALNQAEAMRLEDIASLRARADKLERSTFLGDIQGQLCEVT